MNFADGVGQPAELRINGDIFYAGLIVLPFHIFEYEGRTFLFNINKTKAYEIDAETAARLLPYVDLDAIIPSSAAALLRRFQLIADDPQDLSTFTREAKSPQTFIQTLVLNVIQSCNLRCTYCFAGDGSYGDSGKMSFETARNAIDWYVAQHKGGNFEVNFFGGEPLANFHLIEKSVEYVKCIAGSVGKEFVFSITTNATLVTPRVATFFAANKFRVAVSIDGPAEVNDLNRPTAAGKASTTKVLDGLGILRKHGVAPIARCTVYGDVDVSVVRSYLREIGFEHIHVATATAIVSDQYGREDIENAAAASIANSVLEREEVEAGTASGLYVLNQVSKTAKSISIGERLTHACGVGSQIASVGRDGGLYACHRFTNNPEFKIGDTSSGLYEERFVDRNVDEIPKCKSCWVRYLCGGGCRHDNLYVGGHVFEPSDLFCSEMKAHVEQAVILACKEQANS